MFSQIKKYFNCGIENRLFDGYKKALEKYIDIVLSVK
jgi:hypothetical protein